MRLAPGHGPRTGQSPCPQGSHVLIYRANEAPTILWVFVSHAFLPHCHLCILKQNSQPPAKDSEPLVPQSPTSVLCPSLAGPVSLPHPWALPPSLFTVLLTPGRSPAPPWPGFSVLVPHWPLGPGSSLALLPCRPSQNPRSQASHPGCNRSHRASETMGKMIAVSIP